LRKAKVSAVGGSAAAASIAPVVFHCDGRLVSALVPESSTEQTSPNYLTYFRLHAPIEQKPRPKLDLEAEALAALEQARTMPPGPERNVAMKQAGVLRNAAELQGIFFAKRGRPAKP